MPTSLKSLVVVVLAVQHAQLEPAQNLAVVVGVATPESSTYP
jgi:hypothetical protein